MPSAPEQAANYLRRTLPDLLENGELDEFRRIGVPVALVLEGTRGPVRTVLQAGAGGLGVLPDSAEAVSTFLLSPATFAELVAGSLSPQRAFFTGRVRISGDKLTALRVASVLERVFRRAPASGRGMSETALAKTGDVELLSEQQRLAVDRHLHPVHGAPFWVEKARVHNIVARDLASFSDLARLGAFDRHSAGSRPWRELVPPGVLSSGQTLSIGETGGTTGPALRSAWSDREFRRAFVEPLLGELDRRGVNGLRQWLFVGPTGPHIIGQAARALARETTRVDPHCVDFDPRWARKLSPGSLASQRYVGHLVEQALDILAREHVDALFVTPSVLDAMIPVLQDATRAALRLVHLGGQAVSPGQALTYRHEFGPTAQVINGYGNSLFGCLIEGDDPVTYRYPSGPHVVRVESAGQLGRRVNRGGTGRITCHRFDQTMLLLNVVERDEAEDLGDSFRFPRPVAETAHLVAGGIY